MELISKANGGLRMVMAMVDLLMIVSLLKIALSIVVRWWLDDGPLLFPGRYMRPGALPRA
jgi:hypothetical protein